VTVKRCSIDVENHGHGQLPIPAASRVGPIIATGGIRGADPATGKMPDELEAQVRFMFVNLKRIIEAGGGSADSIVKVTVFVKSTDAKPLVDAEWVKLFPDARARPARHMLKQDLAGAMLVQCDAIAVALDA